MIQILLVVGVFVVLLAVLHHGDIHTKRLALRWGSYGPDEEGEVQRWMLALAWKEDLIFSVHIY